jgi:hypothetical protein
MLNIVCVCVSGSVCLCACGWLFGRILQDLECYLDKKVEPKIMEKYVNGSAVNEYSCSFRSGAFKNDVMNQGHRRHIRIVVFVHIFK